MTIRERKVDILKGILIYLVILGHCIQIIGNDFWGNNLVKFIYSFHMPLFMLLSGYVFAYTVHNSLGTIITKSCRLLIPIISWGLIDYFISLILDDSSFSMRNLIMNVTVAGLWFLYVVVFNQCLFGFVWKIINNKKVAITIIIFAFFLLLLLAEYIHFVRMIVFMYPYFAVGFLGKYYEDYLSKYCTMLWTLSIFLFPILLLNYDSSSYIYTTGVSLLKSTVTPSGQIAINLFRWIIGFCGCGLFFVIARLIENQNNTLVVFISAIGKISLQIYVIQHVFIFRIVQKFFPLLSGKYVNDLANCEYFITYLICPIIAILVLGMIIISIHFLTKNKKISLGLFGR